MSMFLVATGTDILIIPLPSTSIPCHLMQPPIGTLRHVLQTNSIWWKYFKKHEDTIPPVAVENIVKMLSCGLVVRGSAQYTCEAIGCHHSKLVNFTCKSRFCPSCGKKLTEAWIQTQKITLPETEYQHITFTMPKTLWRLFDLNRTLLNDLPRLAYEVVQSLCRAKKIMLAVFVAIHTFGRDLQWHPHIHLSTTRGGLSFDKSTWKPFYFKKKALMKAWKYRLIRLLREKYKNNQLMLPPSLRSFCPDIQSFNQWLNTLYQRHWIVHCGKPSKSHWRNVSYLGRYLKRPPIAQSRLKHYGGGRIVFNYLNHRTNKHQNFECSDDEFIRRFIQHIPPKHFRMIRYYGVLANRNRGQLLPLVYELLEQQMPAQILPVRWGFLLKAELGIDPLACIICKQRLKLGKIIVGKSSAQLMNYHEKLAKSKPIR